jgi:hypothetical protein
MARAAARDALTRTTMGSAPKFRLVAGGLRAYMLARMIANGVESKRARIIYPSMYALSRHFPNLTRWALDHLTPPIKAFAPTEERPAGKPEKT